MLLRKHFIVKFVLFNITFNVSGAAARRCSVKKVLLEISQNFIKKETLTQVFSCEFCETSKNTLSYRKPLVATLLYQAKYIFALAIHQLPQDSNTLLLLC